MAVCICPVYLATFHYYYIVAKQKYYVVWKGRNPGIYSTWDEANQQVLHFEGARYKSFPSLKEAEQAFSEGPGKRTPSAKKGAAIRYKSGAGGGKIIWDSVSVDAACSGNPGKMEYQGVLTKTGEQIFHFGPAPVGTNNIGEFLAIVHALALLHKKGDSLTPIYTDSRTALKWVKDKRAATKLPLSAKTKELLDMVRRAEEWLRTHTYKNQIIKWETEVWGEIPADFGRK